ncbi:heparinase II/III domain-containing protein [Glutamicibacter sp. AOP5-A2-7]
MVKKSLVVFFHADYGMQVVDREVSVSISFHRDSVMRQVIHHFLQASVRQTDQILFSPKALLNDVSISDEYLEIFNQDCSDILDRYALMKLFPESILGKLGNLRILARDLYAEGLLAESLNVLAKVSRISKNEKDVNLLRVRGDELRLIADPDISFQAKPEHYETIKNSVVHFTTIYPGNDNHSKFMNLLRELSRRGYSSTVIAQTQHPRYLMNSPQFDSRIKIIYTAPPSNETENLHDSLSTKFQELLELTAASGPALIHCHGGHINFLMAKNIARVFQIPLVYSMNENPNHFRVKTMGSITETEISRTGSLGSHQQSPAAQMAEAHKVLAASCVIADSANAINRAMILGKSCHDLFLLESLSFDTKDSGSGQSDENAKSHYGHSPRISFLIDEIQSGSHSIVLKAIRDLVDSNPELSLSISTTMSEDPGFLTSLHAHELLSFVDLVPVAINDNFETIFQGFDMIVVNSSRGELSSGMIQKSYPFTTNENRPKVCFLGSNQAPVDAIFEPLNDSRNIADFIKNWITNSRLPISSSKSFTSRLGTSNVLSRVADKLSDVYQSRDVVPVRFESVVENGHLSVTTSTVRRSRTKVIDRSAAVKYLQLHGVDEIPIAKNDALDTINTGWSAYGHTAVDLELPVRWRDVGPVDRSWRMHFHSWEFMHAPLMLWAVEGDNDYLMWCVDRAISWIDEFSDIEDVSSMAWYDMALAYRTVVLMCLVRAAEYSDSISSVQYHKLLCLAELHRDAHYTSEAFNPRNNHGYYSAASQILLGNELADLPGMEALVLQGEERLRQMTNGQFISDGGHSEHSPEYHRMLLGGFDAALSVGLIRDPRVKERISKAADALGWMIQPDGCLVQLGDTPLRTMVGRKLRSTSSQTQWILSSGNEGQPTESKMLVLPASGYVFIRKMHQSGFQHFADASYLALTSAFHSRAHKHCDDNSIVWFENGQQILLDGGRYKYGDLLPADSELRTQGFYYADPTRQLMESAAAHSTVSAGGALHDRRRKPHGSGIISAHETGQGTFQLETQTPHGAWTHRRDIQYRPKHEMIVVDTISPHESTTRDYYIWWQFDGSLSLNQVGSIIYVKSPLWVNEVLRVDLAVDAESITVFKADERLRGGWRSKLDRDVEDSWTVRLKVVADNELKVPTTFRFHKLETYLVERS